LIADHAVAEPSSVTALACKKGITVITITSTGMLMAHGYMRRLFEVFERHRTSVDVVSTSEVSVSVTVDEVTHLESIVAGLSAFAEVSVAATWRSWPSSETGWGRSGRVLPGGPRPGGRPAPAGVAGGRQAQRDAGHRRGRFVACDGPTSCRILRPAAARPQAEGVSA
jgi:hypothetical protein